MGYEIISVPLCLRHVCAPAATNHTCCARETKGPWPLKPGQYTAQGIVAAATHILSSPSVMEDPLSLGVALLARPVVRSMGEGAEVETEEARR